jgi:hypothetical protein
MVDARDARGMTASQPGFHVIIGTQQPETNMIRWAFCRETSAILWEINHDMDISGDTLW